MWSGCSTSCGGGLSYRTRQCNSPPPDPEGQQCVGSTNETRPCNTNKCPGKIDIAVTRDFQHYDILTSVDSDEPVQPLFKLGNSK